LGTQKQKKNQDVSKKAQKGQSELCALQTTINNKFVIKDEDEIEA